MKTTETIKNFQGKILGYIETDSVSGDMVGKDFYRRIVGYYNKKLNVTQDFYRRIVGRGNMLASLIVQEEAKHK